MEAWSKYAKKKKDRRDPGRLLELKNQTRTRLGGLGGAAG